MKSRFEGSMYTFVFLRTPALSPDGEHIPHGMIFACFMVSSMAGSALSGRLLASGSGSVLFFPLYCCAASCRASSTLALAVLMLCLVHSRQYMFLWCVLHGRQCLVQPL